MHSDIIYYQISVLGLPWAIVALGFALSDYIFNIIMCSIIGGVNSIKRFPKNRKSKTFKDNLAALYKKYQSGSKRQIKEFQKDKLSWIWPLTSLAIPTFIYGTSREIITKGVDSLEKINIPITEYSILPINDHVQIIVLGIAVFLSLRTFYRYHRERSKPTWFSKFWYYSLSRITLFNLPLSYMVISIIYMWLQYATTLYQMLSNSQLQYMTFHPDLMYGLKTAYNTVITMGSFLLILSLLPVFMLIREKQENYNKMYLLLVYVGLIILFFMLGILVSKFDQRIGNIREAALSGIQFIEDLPKNSDLTDIKKLQHFLIVSNLPGGFPIPAWFSFFLSARSAVFILEIIRIVSPSTKKSNAVEILQKILSK